MKQHKNFEKVVTYEPLNLACKIYLGIFVGVYVASNTLINIALLSGVDIDYRPVSALALIVLLVSVLAYGVVKWVEV